MTDRRHRWISRRDALHGVALAGFSAPLLAACSAGGDAGNPPAPTGPVAPTGAIPEGSGKIFAERQLVVTQPEPGTFKGFSATCTHQGCTVGEVTDTINCPCHGSKYSIVDGSVVAGPAPKPLPEIALTVNGEQISRA